MDSLDDSHLLTGQGLGPQAEGLRCRQRRFFSRVEQTLQTASYLAKAHRKRSHKHASDTPRHATQTHTTPERQTTPAIPPWRLPLPWWSVVPGAHFRVRKNSKMAPEWETHSEITTCQRTWIFGGSIVFFDCRIFKIPCFFFKTSTKGTYAHQEKGLTSKSPCFKIGHPNLSKAPIATEKSGPKRGPFRVSKAAQRARASRPPYILSLLLIHRIVTIYPLFGNTSVAEHFCSRTPLARCDGLFWWAPCSCRFSFFVRFEVFFRPLVCAWHNASGSSTPRSQSFQWPSWSHSFRPFFITCTLGAQAVPDVVPSPFVFPSCVCILPHTASNTFRQQGNFIIFQSRRHCKSWILNAIFWSCPQPSGSTTNVHIQSRTRRRLGPPSVRNLIFHGTSFLLYIVASLHHALWAVFINSSTLSCGYSKDRSAGLGFWGFFRHFFLDLVSICAQPSCFCSRSHHLASSISSFIISCSLSVVSTKNCQPKEYRFSDGFQPCFLFHLPFPRPIWCA